MQSTKYFLIILFISFSLYGFAQSKKYPEELAPQIEDALSYFPELNNVKIDFVFRDRIKNAIMQAQPRVRTLFKKSRKRTYKIKIKRELVFGTSVTPINEIPHDILVGWLAHELGHVVDYLDRTSFQMIGFGVNYITSTSFLKKAEKRADKYAVHRGCADYIIKTKNYILNHEHLSEDYKSRINELYLSPQEVRDIEFEYTENLK